MTRFADAVIARDLTALEATLHPDAVFRSPAVFAPYDGRDATMQVLRAVMSVLEDFRYTAQYDAADGHVLRFAARVGELEVDGVDILAVDGDGLVTELSVMIRPYKALTAVLTAVGQALENRS